MTKEQLAEAVRNVASNYACGGTEMGDILCQAFTYLAECIEDIKVES